MTAGVTRIVIDGMRLYTEGRGEKKVTKQGWWIHPSLNEWAWGANPFARNSLKKTWAAKVVQACRGVQPIHGQVIVAVWSYLSTDRDADIDNYTPKFIMDGLVEAGVVDGDSRRIVVDLRTRVRFDGAPSRTVIQIWKPSPDEMLELGLPAQCGRARQEALAV